MQAIHKKYKEDCYNCCPGNFLGGNVCKRHMKARDLEDGGQMVAVSNGSQPNLFPVAKSINLDILLLLTKLRSNYDSIYQCLTQSPL